MPISGRFQADFSSFIAAVDAADAKLKSFEDDSAKVEKQLTRMGNSLSGTKLIQDAELAAESVRRMGGPAKLTGAELERVGALAAEASEKMKKLGIGVPEDLQRLAAASAGARGSAEGLTQSFRQFDGLLTSLGIHIGPEVKAIGELAGAAETTGSALGALGAAGLAVGTAIASWKIGTKIGEVTGLTDAVEAGAKRLLGWGDNAEAAGAKADLLASASAKVHRDVTSVNEALAINQGFAERFTAAAKDANDALERMEGPRKSAEALQHLRDEMSKLAPAGVVAALTEDLRRGSDSADELAKRYLVDVSAIQQFGRELAAADAIAEKNAQTLQRLQAELDRDAQRRAQLAGRYAEDTKDLEAAAYADTLKASGHTTDAIVADINRWVDAEVAALDRSVAGWEAKEAAIRALGQKRVDAAGVDFSAIEKFSLTAANAQADDAQRTYDYALEHASELRNGAVQYFADIARAARQAAERPGIADMADATDKADEQAQKLAATWYDVQKAAHAAADAAKDAAAITTVDYGTEQGQRIANSPNAATLADYQQMLGMEAGAKAWDELQRAIEAGRKALEAAAANKRSAPTPPPGSSYTGAYDTTGSAPPQILPPGSPVGGGGVGASGAGAFQVNLVLDGQVLARVVGDVFMRKAKSARLYPGS